MMVQQIPSEKKKKNLHYICGSSSWGHRQGSSDRALPPRSLQRNSVIQSGVLNLKRWPSLHPNCQPRKCAQEYKCIMYNTNDGHFNPLRKFGNEVKERVFFLIFIFLLCLAFFCAFLRDHSVSLFLFFFLLHKGLASLQKRKVQYGFLTYFLVLREGFFTPSF